MGPALQQGTPGADECSRPLRRISFVEDDADIRMVAELALADENGLDVQLCASGHEAIEQVPDFAPDLMVLDVRMPGMSGPETLARLRACPTLAKTPAIFMTASSETIVSKLLEMPGIVGIVRKPFDPMTLSESLQSLWQSAVQPRGDIA